MRASLYPPPPCFDFVACGPTTTSPRVLQQRLVESGRHESKVQRYGQIYDEVRALRKETRHSVEDLRERFKEKGVIQNKDQFIVRLIAQVCGWVCVHVLSVLKKYVGKASVVFTVYEALFLVVVVVMVVAYRQCTVRVRFLF